MIDNQEVEKPNEIEEANKVEESNEVKEANKVEESNEVKEANKVEESNEVKEANKVEEPNEVKQARQEAEEAIDAVEKARQEAEKAIDAAEKARQEAEEATAKAAIKTALHFLEYYGDKEFTNGEYKIPGDLASNWIKMLCENINSIFKKGMNREIQKSTNSNSDTKVTVNNGNKTVKQFFLEFKDTHFKNSKTSIALFISRQKEIESHIFKPHVFLAIEMREAEGIDLDYQNHNRLLDYNGKLTDENEELARKLYYTIKKNKTSDEHSITSLSKKEIKDEIKNKKIQKVRLQYDIEIDNEKSPIMDQIKKGIELLIPYYDYVVNIPQYNKNIILYGPPGTGKTYHTVYYAVGIIEDKSYEIILSEPYENVLKRYNNYKKQGQIMFSTFHQSYSYEEFIGGIMPKLNNSSKKKGNNLLYELERGKFKDFCDKAKDKKGNYVFVIDEINRGNISKIFGELITLIEESKRLGEKEEMKLQIPHFKEEFGVPNNVYIIGTMNTADRSIALIDTALRRRFNFIEMMPNPEVLKEKIGKPIKGKINICEMLETINNRISVLYDREHTIGHAYFTSLIENPSLEQLAKIFRNSIIPLLQEYFYEDYEKIQLVLGDNAKSQDRYKFIKVKEGNGNKLFKGKTDIDIAEKEYEINQEAFLNPKSYIEIYSSPSNASKGSKSKASKSEGSK